MSKIDAINNVVEKATTNESGKRTKAVTDTAPVTKFPAYGSEVIGFSKSTLVPRSGSEFLLEIGTIDEKKYGFELALVTHASLKFSTDQVLEQLKKKLPIIKDIKFINNELIGVLDKSVFIKTPNKSNLMDASCGGLLAHLNYEAIPSVLFSISTESNIFVMENEFVVKLNSNIVALNFLIHQMIVTTDVTMSKDNFKNTIKQILKNVRINSSVSKKYLNVAVQFTNVDNLPDSIFLNIFEKSLVAVNTQLTTDLFSIKVNKELRKMDNTSQCVFTSAGDLLKNATKGDELSKCLVKPKAGISYAPIIKLSNDYLHPILTGSSFAQVSVDSKCDDNIIKEVFKDIINNTPVTIKSLDTDNLFMVPDVFKLLQFGLLKEMKEIQVGGEVKTVQPNAIVTPLIRVNVNINTSLISAIFTI